MHVSRIEYGYLDRVGGDIDAHRRGGEAMAETGRQQVHQLRHRQRLADLRRVDARELDLEPGFVERARADERARERARPA